MTLNHAELAAVALDLRPLAAHARVQKIHQRGEDTILLRLHGPDLDAWLVVSCRPGLAHMGLAEERGEAESTPPRFCAALRKHVEGARVVEIEAVPGDRVVTISVEGREGLRTIVAELFGRNGNLVLIDGEGRVLDAAHPGVGDRSTRIGDIYRDPPKPGGGTTATVREFGPGSLAFAVAARYAEQGRDAAAKSLRAETASALKKALKRARQRLDVLTREWEGLEDAEKIQRDAEHLAANVGRVGKGLTSIEIDDWYGGPPRVVALDPKLSPAKNVEAMFHRAARTRRKKEALTTQVPEAERIVAEWQTRIAALEAVGDEEIAALRDRWVAERVLKPRRAEGRPATEARAQQASGPRRYVGADGAEILVGRNAAENDELTFRIARGNDWWFHVSGQAGSHVVVKMPAGKSLSQEALLDAATLAVMGSKTARQRAGEVHYTQRKYVRKPKGAPPGRVTAENTKAVFVRVDEERLKRLNDRRE